MMNREIEITNALAENEELIGKLYQVYADKFPDYRQSWQDLVEEEKKHAAKIRQLVSEAEKGHINIKPYRFNIVAIQNQMKHVEDEIRKAAGPEYSLTNALSYALNIENGLIEQKYFEVFDTYSLEVKNVFADLAEDTKRHAAKVRELWQKSKKD
jgi:rubrerythrin